MSAAEILVKKDGVVTRTKPELLRRALAEMAYQPVALLAELVPHGWGAH
jgi:hypothetical protein